jgi:hypothetical protein
LEAPPYQGDKKNLSGFREHQVETEPGVGINRLIEEGPPIVPFRNRLKALAALFEAFISARGFQQRDEIFQRLLPAEPTDLLAVGLKQYELCGNGDRLRLTANLLVAAGQRAYNTLTSLTNSYRPELIYLVDGIAASIDLTDAHKVVLLRQLIRAAEADADLAERVESALEWLPPDLRRRVRETMELGGTLGRAA